MKYVTLNVSFLFAEKPTLLKQPQSSTVEVGGTAIFECEARADPRPDYRWYKNNEIYQQGVGFRTKRLVLSEVIPNDEGEYICEAFNTVGNKKSKVATLKVVGENLICFWLCWDSSHELVWSLFVPLVFFGPVLSLLYPLGSFLLLLVHFGPSWSQGDTPWRRTRIGYVTCYNSIQPALKILTEHAYFILGFLGLNMYVPEKLVSYFLKIS